MKIVHKILILLLLLSNISYATIIPNRGQFDKRAKYIINSGTLFITDSSIVCHKNNELYEELVFSSKVLQNNIFEENKSNDFAPKTYIISKNGKSESIHSVQLESLKISHIFENIDLLIHDNKSNLSTVEFIINDSASAIDINKIEHFKTIFAEYSNLPRKGHKNPIELQSGRLVNNVIYSSYFGGSDYDIIRDMEVDEHGSIYIMGHTLSPDFYIKNAYDKSLDTSQYDYSDIFITKFDSTARRVIFSTYIGSHYSEFGECIAIDKDKNVIIGGTTKSYNEYPVTDDALFPEMRGNYDGVISKISADGSQLLYSTLFGGNHDDYIQDLHLDNAGNLIICGYTKSTEGFPITANAYQKTNNGSYDGFCAVIDRNLNNLVYCTYIGGLKDDFIQNFTFDDQNKPVFVGLTYSGNFPQKTSLDLMNITAGTSDICLFRFDNVWQKLDFSLLIGGENDDEGFSLDKDRAGNIHVVGNTESVDFPITYDALFKVANNGKIGSELTDVAYFIYSPYKDKLEFATYLGGRAYDYGLNLRIDNTNAVNITGYTTSTDFPVTKHAIQSELIDTNNTSDIFITRLTHNGRQMNYSTYFGGSNNDVGHGIFYNQYGEMLVAGRTQSNDFPITKNALDKILDDVSETEIFLLLFEPEFTEIYSNADSVIICRKDVAKLEAFFIPANDTNLTVSWKPDYNLDRTDSLVVFASPDKTTLYTAFVSDSTGVRDSVSILVYIQHTPSNYIHGLRYTYPDSIETYWVDIEANTAYQWATQNGDLLTDDNTESIKVRWGDAKVNKVKMIASNNLSCSDSSEITVYCGLPYTFNLDKTGDTVICKDDFIIVDAGQYATYFWNDGTITRYDTLLASGKYWCHTTNDTDDWGYSDTISIVVDTLPQIPIYGRLVVAQDDTLEYQVFMDTNFVYSWYIENGEILDGQGSDWVQVHWSPDSLWGKILLAATNDLGCTDTTFYDVFIGKTYPPEIIALNGSTVICPNDYAILDATEGYLEYYWNTGDTNRVISVNTPGHYWCEVTAVYDDILYSDTVSVSFNPMPGIPRIEYNEVDKVLICLDLSDIYQWYLVNSPEDSLVGEGKELFYIIAGQYYVVVTNEFGCSRSSQDTATVGIVDYFIDNNIKILPNPNSGIFEVYTENILTMNSTMMIFDSQGTRVKVLQIKNDSDMNPLIIDLHSCASGTYSLLLITDRKIYSQRFIIVK